jgi:hypothetical protein
MTGWAVFCTAHPADRPGSQNCEPPSKEHAHDPGDLYMIAAILYIIITTATLFVVSLANSFAVLKLYKFALQDYLTLKNDDIQFHDNGCWSKKRSHKRP